MADDRTAKAVQALRETRPPATDRFTYLTLVQDYLSADVLPALDDLLQEAELAQDIGWDLVEMLVPLLPASDACLETIARLGNPREVMLKVLEVLEGLHRDDGDGDEDEDDGTAEEEEEHQDRDARKVRTFITLLGMLAILHRRIRTKFPSRFLVTTLRTVLAAYRPAHGEMTASVVNLVHSLSARSRPPLPSRKSSIEVADPDRDGDASKNAPDPEADRPPGDAGKDDPAEGRLQQRLLLVFVTCVVEAHANANALEWAPRLWEYYNPERLVPGRPTALQRFRDDGGLLGRDTFVGQLVALAHDLGLDQCDRESLYRRGGPRPIRRQPLAVDIDDLSGPDDVALATGGYICILAYWVFSSTVFKAGHQPQPEPGAMFLLPDHFSMLQAYLEDDAQSQIADTPGTIDAIIAVGLWLGHRKSVLSDTAAEDAEDADGGANFMSYHHLITLCAVYHPALAVRNAAVALAGLVLHADPDEDDRLKILEDLLENCIFASLKACAVTWLREEIISAAPADGGRFATPDAMDQLQYAVFPDMQSLADVDRGAFLEYWLQNSPFLLQAANFAYFLLRPGGRFADVVPPAMGPAVEQRFVEPLMQAASAFLAADGAAGKAKAEEDGMEHVVLDLSILVDRLKSLKLS